MLIYAVFDILSFWITEYICSITSITNKWELLDTLVGTITLLAFDSLGNVHLVRVNKCVRCWLVYQCIDLLNRFEMFILYILAIMHTVPAMLCLGVVGNRTIFPKYIRALDY